MNDTHEIHLLQKHWLFGKREFVLHTDDSLTIKEQSWFRKDETTIPLELLQDNPTYATNFSLKWLLNSLFIGSITLLILSWAIQLSSIALYGLSIVFAGMTLVLLYRFFLFTTDLVIYRHAQTSDNFVYLWNEKPTFGEFWYFVNELNQRLTPKQSK